MYNANGSAGGLKPALLWFLVFVVFVSAASWYFLFRPHGTQEVSFGEPPPADTSSATDSRPVLRVAIAAMISPEATRDYYYELLSLIGDRIGRRTVFLQRRTYAEVNNLIENAEVDLAFVCAGPYVKGHDGFGMELLAAPVVHGEMVYHSYIIAPQDSVAASLTDMRGRRFAFTDPDSNTGCLVPRYMLSGMGETPETFFSQAFYTHSHDNSITAVATGQADGAAVDSLIWEFMSRTRPDITSQTKVVQKSPPYGIPPIVVHPGLDPELKGRLRDTLLGLHEDEEAAALLEKLQIDRFEVASDSDYDEVRRMEDWLAR